MEFALNQGHSTFRNQPPYTVFNKSFDDPEDILFLQLNEIDPYFLSKEQLEDDKGFSQKELIDPRTKKEQLTVVYNHSDRGKSCSIFKGGGIKSTLTKLQHNICLRVLLGWQEKSEILEADLIVWRQLEGKIKKERDHMQKFIAEYSEAHKEDMYAPTKRLNDFYRNWFKRKANILLRKHTENLTYNTHTGLPHVSVCRSPNEEKAEICDVQLVERSGWIRLLDDDREIEWRNFNFRLETHFEKFIAGMDTLPENIFEKRLATELKDFEEQENYKICYLPFETILFLLTAGDYVDLPTECLLEIQHDDTGEQKVIKFNRPLPARNCGWHTQQQVVDQAFTAFLSVTGRSRWLHVDNERVEPELLKTNEIHAVNEGLDEFKPTKFEQYLENHIGGAMFEEELKTNTAFVKWLLKVPNSIEGIKVCTSFSLPPTLDEKATNFLAHETLKLEYKPQFGCEMLTKYELLCVWLKIRLMGFAKTTDYGLCYRLSTIDCDIELKEHLSLETVEHFLKHYYHVNPSQLISNLSEFLKLLYNMPPDQYMLRYNSKYKDKFLLCAPSQEITQNTVYLHSLLQAVPTDMSFMTQPQFLPIVETLCSRVHQRYKILPCAFLPKLPHQKNLKTAAEKANAEKLATQKKEAAKTLALKESKIKPNNEKMRKQKEKRARQQQKRRAAQKKLREEEAESKKLLEF